MERLCRETGDTLNGTIILPIVLEMLDNLKGASVLDAGCGSGYLTAKLARHAKKVTGTDFAPNFIALCQQKYKDQNNVEFVLHNIEQQFPFADASFDAIVCKMVLHYVRDIRPFVNEAMRMLKVKGKLVVVVDYPFRAAYFSTQQPDNFTPTPDIFSDKPKTKTGLWGKTELTWYARTTSRYVQNFIDSGFQLAEIREPLAQQDSAIPFSVLALKFIKT